MIVVVEDKFDYFVVEYFEDNIDLYYIDLYYIDFDNIEIDFDFDFENLIEFHFDFEN